jgi:hypothetical protein
MDFNSVIRSGKITDLLVKRSRKADVSSRFEGNNAMGLPIEETTTVPDSYSSRVSGLVFPHFER